MLNDHMIFEKHLVFFSKMVNIENMLKKKQNRIVIFS